MPSIWSDFLKADLPFDTRGAHASLRFVTISGGDLSREKLERLPGLLDGGLGRRVDRQWTVQGRLMRRVGDRASVGGAITVIRRASSFPGLSYHGLRYGLQAEVAP